VQADRAVQQAAGLGNRHGGIMRIGRVLIIPAIVAFGAAGSILASSAMPVAAVHAPGVHVEAVTVSPVPGIYYHI
jgi:hypothetical protein